MSEDTTTTAATDATTTTAAATATDTTTTSAGSSFSIYGDSGANPQFLDSIKASAPSLAAFLGKYPSLDKAESGLKHVNYLASQKGLMPLDENAPEDVKAKHQETLQAVLGIPKDASGYHVEKPEGYPEELGWSDERIGKFAEIAREHNISPAGLQAIVAAHAAEQMEEFGRLPELEKAARAETLANIKSEHGAKFEERFGQATAALNIAKSLGALTDEDMKTIDVTANEREFRILSVLGSLLNEQKFVKPGSGGGDGGLQAELNTLRARPEYMNPPNPQVAKEIADEQHRIFRLAQARGINLK